MLRTSSLTGALVAQGFDVTVFAMVGRKRDYLARKPSGTEMITDRLHEYVDRRRLWALLQFASYRLGLPPVWITFLLALGTPRKLREMLDACDAIIVDFPYLFPAVPRSGKPAVLNTHNVEADLCKHKWMARIVSWIESRAARRVQHVFCCTERDRMFFANLTGEGRTSLVPNGIYPARFAGIQSERASLRASLGYKDADRVLLFPASSFAPNVEALNWLEQFVAQHQELLARHRLKFLVVGSVSKQPFERNGLKAVGMVQRIEPYFAAADIAYNGVFRGSGTNLKMAEFMAVGLPILTTPAGIRGYDLVDGVDCLVFTPEGLAKTIEESPVLKDRTLLMAMARSAYEKNARVIDMSRCIEPLARWLNDAAAKDGRRPSASN